MEELEQYLKDLINEVYHEHGQDKLSEANDWDLYDDDRIITAYPVKTNPDWGSYCYDASVSKYGTGIEQLLVRWTFNKLGRPIILDGDKSEEMGLILNDDFSGLEGHYFNMQGLLYPKRDLS